MDSYAIVKNGIVINVVAWDGSTAWSPPEGTEAVPAEETGVGWLYDGTAFKRPPEPEE